MIELVVAVSGLRDPRRRPRAHDRRRPEPRPQQPQSEHRGQPCEPGDGQGPPGDLHVAAARAGRHEPRRSMASRTPCGARPSGSTTTSTTGPCDSTNANAAGAAGLGQRVLGRHAWRRAREVVDDPEPAGRLVRPDQRPHRGEGAGQHRGPARRRPGQRHGHRLHPQPDDHLRRLRVLRVRPAVARTRSRSVRVGYVDRQGHASPTAGHRRQRRARPARSRSTTTRPRR